MEEFKKWCDEYLDESNFESLSDHMMARMLLLSLWQYRQEEIDKLARGDDGRF